MTLEEAFATIDTMRDGTTADGKTFDVIDLAIRIVKEACMPAPDVKEPGEKSPSEKDKPEKTG